MQALEAHSLLGCFVFTGLLPHQVIYHKAIISVISAYNYILALAVLDNQIKFIEFLTSRVPVIIAN